MAIYQVLCEHLETIDRVADAVECFHQMMSELSERTNLGNEHLEWTLGEWLCNVFKNRHLRVIFYQTLDSVPPKSWNISEIQRWMHSDTMMPSPTIRPR